MLKKEHINPIITAIITLILTLMTGYAIGYHQAKASQTPEIRWEKDINTGIPTILMMKVENGAVFGKTVSSQVRVVTSPENILTIKPEEEFKIPLNAISMSEFYESAVIPDDARFVASKNGKYYYTVFSGQAMNLKKENRVYFSDDKGAQRAGFTKKE